MPNMSVCAVRRRAERRNRRTKSSVYLWAARSTQKNIRRHFDKVSRKSWMNLCVSLDHRKLLSFSWRIVQRLSMSSQRYRPFSTLALSTGCQELVIAEGYCSLVAGASTVSAKTLHTRNTPQCVDGDIEVLCALTKLRSSLSTFNHYSSPGHDGTAYSSLSNLITAAQSKLLDVFNDYLENGAAPDTWKLSSVILILKP